MGRAYKFLLINDTNTLQTRYFARTEDDSYTINVGISNSNSQSSYYPGVEYLAEQMAALVQQGVTFRKCIFTTHGNAGTILFGANDEITSFGWRKTFNNRGLYRLFPWPDTKIYFSGCQVAAESSGWQFLEAAAVALLRGAGGWTFGWTSDGYRFPFWDAPQHFSGAVRAVSISPGAAGGASLRYYQDWNVITDGQGDPIRPY